MAKAKLSFRTVNLNSLCVLAALVELRSVSRAASELGVTQSAVSHSLSQLRRLFDDQLLVRSREGMIPTPCAERLAERVRRGLIEIEAALTDAAEFDPGSSERRFTIAAEDHMGAIVLQSLVWMVRGDAPNVTFRLVAPDARTGVDLTSGDVDVAIASSLDGAGLRRATLLSDEFACLVRRDHPEVQGRITMEQLSALPHAVLGRPDAGLAKVEAALVAAGVQRRVAIELPYFLLAPTLVPFSELILIAPRTLGKLFALGYPLQVLDLPLELPAIEEHVYWHQRFDADPAHAWLRAQVVRCVDEFFARIRDQEVPLVGAWPEIPAGHRG